MEVQEALPPAGVLGAEPLSLMLQHFPREPAKRCFQAMAANQVFFVSQVFSTVWVFCPVAPDETAPLRLLLNPAVERERRKHAQGVLQAVKKSSPCGKLFCRNTDGMFSAQPKTQTADKVPRFKKTSIASAKDFSLTQRKQKRLPFLSRYRLKNQSGGTKFQRFFELFL